MRLLTPSAGGQPDEPTHGGLAGVVGDALITVEPDGDRRYVRLVTVGTAAAFAGAYGAAIAADHVFGFDGAVVDLAGTCPSRPGTSRRAGLMERLAFGGSLSAIQPS